MTHRTASIVLDFPHPLGPTIPVRLLESGMVVGSTKDLNPANLIFVKRIEVPDAMHPNDVRSGLYVVGKKQSLDILLDADATLIHRRWYNCA